MATLHGLSILAPNELSSVFGEDRFIEYSETELECEWQRLSPEWQ